MSQSEFYFSLLAVFDENATSLFAYDYADSPPSPFFSIYLVSLQRNDPRRRRGVGATGSCDRRMLQKGEMQAIRLNLSAGDGLTELRFVWCPQFVDVMTNRRCDA